MGQSFRLAEREREVQVVLDAAAVECDAAANVFGSNGIEHGL